MEIGIAGLPGTGKTVVFNALSRAQVPIATYSTPSSEPNRATVKVPDVRLVALAELFRPKKVTPAEVRYVDVAGLTQGMGSDAKATQILAHLRNCDALLVVVRAFVHDAVPHPLGSVDPERDLEILATEMMLADLAVAERRLERLDKELKLGKGSETERQVRAREHALIEAVHRALSDGKPARLVALEPADTKLLSGFGFLTQKPWLIVVNSGDDGADGGLMDRLAAAWASEELAVLAVAGRLEMDLAELAPEEAAEMLAAWNLAEPALDRLIQASYRLLKLISFFTVGEDEVRAWTIERGMSAVDAAAAIHTDIARAFIRAEVVRCQDLLSYGSMAEARRHGVLRSEGRAYIVQDGDVAHFLHNAG